MLNLRYYFGIFLVIIGVFSVSCAICSFIYSELLPFLFFTFFSVCLLLIGSLIWRSRSNGLHGTHEASVMVVGNFIAVIMISALPYIIVSGAKLIDGLFESVSGYTTSGMSVFVDVEAFPRGLLLWRSFTEWLGGFALILILILLVKSEDRRLLAKSKGFERENAIPVTSLIRTLLLLYLLLTSVGFLFLSIFGGMTPFDAINHSMTAISTGGFSTKNQGIYYFERAADYNPIVIEVIVNILSLFGMTSFVLISSIFLRRGVMQAIQEKAYTIDREEIKLMTFFLIISTSVISWAFFNNLDLSSDYAIRMGVFHSITSISGTGYNAMPIDNWMVTPKIILIVLFFVGGSAWSAAGAIKLNRVYYVLRSIPKLIVRKTSITLEAKEAWLYLASYVLVTLVGLILLWPFLREHQFIDVLYQVAATPANSGPQIIDVSQVHPFGKLCFISLMLLGYFEIYPLLSLFKTLFTQRRFNS